MGKLFNQEDVTLPKTSMEEFVSFHKHSQTVATEAIKDFFSQTKDVFSNAIDRLDSSKEKAMIDASSSKYEVINISKRIETAHIAHELVTIPERFKGLYIPYLEDLIKVSEDVIPDTIKLLENIKLAVAGFVNEYSENEVLTVYGMAYAKTSEGKRIKHQKNLSKYFPSSKTVAKTNVKDIIRNSTDIKTIFDKLPILSMAISEDRLEAIQKLTKDVSEMVDILIEQNTSSGIMTKNTGAKKDLVDLLHIGAKNVEFCGYLHANVLQLYSSIKALSDVYIKVGNR